MVEKLGTEKPELGLSDNTDSVDRLIRHPGKRSQEWEQALNPEKLTVTVNKQISTIAQKLFPGDEVALVPKGE